MKILIIIINILLNFIIPGVSLVAKNRISGYIIYFLFICLHLSRFFTNILHSFFGLSFFLLFYIGLFLAAVILYLRNLKVPTDRHLLLLSVPVGIIVYFTFYSLTGIYPEIKKSTDEYSVLQDKIAFLERYWDSNKFLFLGPCPFQSSRSIDSIPVKDSLPEISKWGPGIYYLIAQRNNCEISLRKGDSLTGVYPNFYNLLSRYEIKADSIPIYFAFLSTTQSDDVRDALVKMLDGGITSVRVVYVKSRDNVERHAINPEYIKRIKHKQSELIASGKSPVAALASVISLEVGFSCPLACNLMDSMILIPPDKRHIYVENFITSNVTTYACNMGKFVDICMLLSMPWYAFSYADYNIKDLIDNDKIRQLY